MLNILNVYGYNYVLFELAMKKISALFPGQGSQYIGMGLDLYNNFSEARVIYNLADHILRKKISDMIFSGSIDNLTKTVNAQLAIFITSFVAANILCKLANKKFHHIFVNTAGHSLGEYTALTMGGIATFRNMLTILRFRSRAMSKINGGMYALFNTTNHHAACLCKKLSLDGICEVACDNGNGLITISGQHESFANIRSYAESVGINRFSRILVNGPFHSSLMAPVSSLIIKRMKQYRFNDPNIRILSNLHAQSYKNKEELPTILAQHIKSKVLWRQTTERIYDEYKCRTFVEIGPNNILSRLLKQQYPEACVYNIYDTKSIEYFLKHEL